MGYIEEESRKRARRGEIQKIILETVATAGILSIALVAPNVLKSLKMLGIDVSDRKKEIVNSARKRLVTTGLLEYDKKGYLKLTEKGVQKLRLFTRENYQIPRPKKWDKKWRVIIFDIKEERKTSRDKIRKTLFMLGFLRLQDSVWVHPYDCEDFIMLLKADFSVGRELLYMVVDIIENDKVLKKEFNLE